MLRRRSAGWAAEDAPALLELLGVDLATGETLAEGGQRSVVRGTRSGAGVPDQPADAQEDQDDDPHEDGEVGEGDKQSHDAEGAEVNCHGIPYCGQARTMIRSSVMSSIAQRRPSRPSPESLTPP